MIYFLVLAFYFNSSNTSFNSFIDLYIFLISCPLLDIISFYITKCYIGFFFYVFTINFYDPFIIDFYDFWTLNLVLLFYERSRRLRFKSL